DPGADRFRRPDAEHLRDRGHRLILARIVGPHLGDHTDSALTKLARILTGTSHKTDPSKESCLRTHRGESIVAVQSNLVSLYPTSMSDLSTWLSSTASPGIYALKGPIGRKLVAHANVAVRHQADRMVVFLP